jgi:hypothetical protein
MTGMHAVFLLAAVMCVVAAIASLLRGEAVIHASHESAGVLPDGADPAVTLETTVLEPADDVSVHGVETIAER